MGLIDSSSGLGIAVSDPTTFATLAASSDSFDNQALMDDHNDQDYNTLADTSNIAPN